MTEAFENSFNRALQEYERKMFAPFDKGGDLYYGDDYGDDYKEWLEDLDD